MVRRRYVYAVKPYHEPDYPFLVIEDIGSLIELMNPKTGFIFYDESRNYEYYKPNPSPEFDSSSWTGR